MSTAKHHLALDCSRQSCASSLRHSESPGYQETESRLLEHSNFDAFTPEVLSLPPHSHARPSWLRTCTLDRPHENEIMMTQPKPDGVTHPILVTGAGGRVGSVGRTVAELLLQQGRPVRAMVRTDDERAQYLRGIGAEVVVGDLLDLDAVHRAVVGCEHMYFGMSVSDDYLAATVNAAAVAKHHGLKSFVNMSQMTVAQMSITETTPSTQHKLHWLAEQALNWSGLPVVHVRPTVFMEGLFLPFTSDSVRTVDEIRLPFGMGKTSPIAAEDVARVVATLLADPEPHIGKVYHLTGPQSETMNFFAEEYSKALGRTITYLDIPLGPWRDGLLERGLPVHLVNHLAAMAVLHQQGRYDRMSGDVLSLTGQAPMLLREFVGKNAATFSTEGRGNEIHRGPDRDSEAGKQRTMVR